VSALVELTDLLVQRERGTVLDIAQLEVRRGEVLAVVGPNGAGKSTLLLVLARLLKPKGGVFQFDGQPVNALDVLAYRRRLALVLQEPLLLDVSVSENLAVGLKFRGVGADAIDRRVEFWLRRLDIAHLRLRPAHKLSGGEAQRVSLGRAFILEPELLLLDEPFGSLDPPTRTRLLEDLKVVIPETSTTTVLITHDLQEAVKFATRLAVLLDGKIQQVGAPEEVFGQPANRQVAEFLGRNENSGSAGPF
jgi:tungstate transport system ATP-binding protein